jgi:hypothetical protein
VSNFWSQRLGQGQQQAPAAPPQPAPSNRPWWQPAPVQQPTHTAPPASVTQPVPQQQASVTPDGKVPIEVLLSQTEYTTEKAQSARDTERCPECDGPNYLAEKGVKSSMKHCFDCGYNPRFTQTMSGISGTGTNVPVKTARMQNRPVEGAPPMGAVIGHV